MLRPDLQLDSIKLYLTSLSLAILLALIVVFNNIAGAIITALLIFTLFLFLFVKHPETVFYLIMMLYVFGEIGIDTNFGIKISISNLLILLGFLVVILRILFKKDKLNSLWDTPAKKIVLLLSLLLLIQDMVSAISNGYYRFLLTRFSYFSIVIIFFSIIKKRKIIYRGLILGLMGVCMLSVLTILRSMDVTSIGYRASVNWGTAPWESFLPRAIGLPSLDGGMHGVFIVSLIPLAVIMGLDGNRVGFLGFKKVGLFVISVLGSAAVAISLYRSAWLGLFTALLIGLGITLRNRLSDAKKLILVIIVVIFGLGILGLFGKAIISYGNNLIFNVRSGGVQQRLNQYRFVLTNMLSFSDKLLVGNGYDNFVTNYAETLNPSNKESGIVTILLHNHFLGFLYAAGWPSLILYLIMLFISMSWLYRGSRSDSPGIRLHSTSLLAGLAGSIIILNFTSRLSGYYIIWMIIAISALLPDETTFVRE